MQLQNRGKEPQDLVSCARAEKRVTWWQGACVLPLFFQLTALLDPKYFLIRVCVANVPIQPGNEIWVLRQAAEAT